MRIGKLPSSIAFIMLAAAIPLSRGQADEPAAALLPGLSASYRSLSDPAAEFWRIDLKPAFFLGRSSPDSRLPAGPFEVVWNGHIDLAGSTPVSFDAFVSGELMIEIDGVVVLQGRGIGETAVIGPGKTLELPAGMARVRITYRSLDQQPARLQIWWQGKTFAREPLPAWRLKHAAADWPARANEDQRADAGRALVGRLGCARCHRGAFPGIDAPPPGPSLVDVRQRLDRAWLLEWLRDPSALHAHATMPALFAADRTGFVERWLIADHLVGDTKKTPEKAVGDHRAGRKQFIANGCTACHFLPDLAANEQPPLERTLLTGLRERMSADHLAAFLGNPLSRYPDGRMPTIPLTADKARDIAAFLLENSPAGKRPDGADAPPTPDEIAIVARRLNAKPQTVAATLLVEKGCVHCHPGLGTSEARDLPLEDKERGCLSKTSLPRYSFADAERKAVLAYLAVAEKEKHASPFASRQRLLAHLGCVRCHQRDSDRPSPLETAGSALGGAFLQNVPFQKAPRLTNPHQKFTQAHLRTAIAEGVSGLRSGQYTYRMPAFGRHADAIVQALAEADGELFDRPDSPTPPVKDPTLGALVGSTLAGFQGYSCVSCHVWNGQLFSQPDPAAVGTDLTRLSGRIRRDWFDRYLEAPSRFHPGTPMPSIFTKDRPALLSTILDGDAAKQKDALWAYFALGKNAPAPKPAPPLVLAAPARGDSVLVAQIPLRLPDETLLESIAVLSETNDLFVYDLATFNLHSAFTKAQIQRSVLARMRKYRVEGSLLGKGFHTDSPLLLLHNGTSESPKTITLHGYDRLDDGVRIRWQAAFKTSALEVTETLRLPTEASDRRLHRTFRITGLHAKQTIESRTRQPAGLAVKTAALAGTLTSQPAEDIIIARIAADPTGVIEFTFTYDLPPTQRPAPIEQAILPDGGAAEGSLERSGYKATAYPRPKTASGGDLIMPGAVAVHPKDGRVFIACMKTGALYVLDDPSGDSSQARFQDYGRGLFQEAYSLLAESDALYVLHRRNLTRIRESKADGRADRFDRVAPISQEIADAYDYGYGLVKDAHGAFVFTQAPHANRRLAAAGNAVRLVPGQTPETIAYGFRNPLGWTTGPGGEIFFTDNQGDWIATNKLCHLEVGRYHGYPNRDQPEHKSRPLARTTVWIPYGWAKSINGVAYDSTAGKFGPFAGQFFLADLMFGGALLRADVEKVNGVYQGVCFPFWDKGLLGPLTLAFDPKGPLYIGSVTEPGWMAQPDRGALFRIDHTGKTPFEINTIRALPNGFRIHFTKPAAKQAADLASYHIESFRYESTGAYGSPELDRTRIPIQAVRVFPDGFSADLITAPLTTNRVYMISARGVFSMAGEPLVYPTGAYTLNEIPSGDERK